MNTAVYCLNPNLGQGHRNQAYELRCKECEFFVRGSQIENYEIVNFLGRGSYGDVYEVREPPPLGRTFALKVLRSDRSMDNLDDTLSQEAKKIAELQHQYILPVYKFGRLENNRPYFIMERAVKNLNQHFRNPDGTARLALVESLVPFVEQAAQALDFIHQSGYIHTDVKPINLLLKNDHHLFLADFGTSQYLGINTHVTLQRAEGTYNYMPLEQLQGKPRRESDQYALAVSVYQLLTEHTPFGRYRRPEQLWNAIMTEEPPHPQQWNPRVPVEVSAVLLRALARDYQRRYPDMFAFAEAYKDAVSIAMQRYRCQQCGYQNRSGARRCSTCGAHDDNRTCPWCDERVRFGQRCCAHCGRLTIVPDMEMSSAFVGLSIRKGRYMIKRVLKNAPETKVLVAVAEDTQANGQLVVLKRWPCIDTMRDATRYAKLSVPLTALRHPLVPRLLEHFIEGKDYYHVQTYVDGESLEERLQKLLRPLPEHEVIHYLNMLLNTLIALEQQMPADSYQFYSITPTNIILDNQRNRASLTGFQLPYRPTIKLRMDMAFSPYKPLEAGAYNQSSLIYSLGACAHLALSNCEPPLGSQPPAIRSLNATVSSQLEAILNRALQERRRDRYQSYWEMQSDLKALL